MAHHGSRRRKSSSPRAFLNLFCERRPLALTERSACVEIVSTTPLPRAGTAAESEAIPSAAASERVPKGSKTGISDTRLVRRRWIWGRSSVGRAPRLQRGCLEFEPPRLHQIESRPPRTTGAGRFSLRRVCATLEVCGRREQPVDIAETTMRATMRFAIAHAHGLRGSAL